MMVLFSILKFQAALVCQFEDLIDFGGDLEIFVDTAFYCFNFDGIL